MTVYISGKIGEEVISEATRQKFAKAQKEPESKGHEVFNPTSEEWQNHLMHGYGADIQQRIAPPGGPISKYAYFLLRDQMALATKDAIYMLSDWKDSAGARTELMFALATGKKVIFEHEEDFLDNYMKLAENLVRTAMLTNSDALSYIFETRGGCKVELEVKRRK